MILERVTDADLAWSAQTVALLPLGATESHGPHLPYGTDTFIASELAKRVAERVPGCIVLPTLPFGMSWAYEDAGLTLSLSPHTLAQAITEILEGLVRKGIERVLIVNGHDGNIASIELAARNVKRLHNVTVAALEAWWMVLSQVVDEDLFSPGAGGHAGEPETALAMVATPDLVRLELARPPSVDPDTRYTAALTGVRVYSMASEHHAHGEFLDASRASVTAGERAMEGLAQYLAAFLEHAARVDWKFGVAGGDRS